ncbi:hypothetical protein L6452_02756 [Arctium lappa]|uniref:Uncharacterized protein n=1 Tax=Arctium lappa TaxID=4217 RepID=A0ACB9FL53_ARCLA|nr:hypothetical protein L6452_02756 [Arctium lappa]
MDAISLFFTSPSLPPVVSPWPILPSQSVKGPVCRNLKEQGSLPECCRSNGGVREGRLRDKREEDAEAEGDEDVVAVAVAV